MALIQKNINWKPYEVIYSAGDEPDGLYLIKEGIVELYTPEGLKLNEISDNEIFGESSIILETKRTVTAKTGKFNVFASFIPKKNFLQLIEKNTALSAIIKKTQLRLIDSNHQSQELTNEIEKLASLIEKTKSDTKKVDKIIEDIEKYYNCRAYSKLLIGVHCLIYVRCDEDFQGKGEVCQLDCRKMKDIHLKSQ